MNLVVLEATALLYEPQPMPKDMFDCQHTWTVYKANEVFSIVEDLYSD